MARGLQEAIRIVLETEGREGVEQLRKSFGQLGDTSSASAEKASKLAAELDRLADTSTNIRNYTKLKATIADTGTALEKARTRMHELATQMAQTTSPSRSLEAATKRAGDQVERLSKLQNRQQAELTRTTGLLRKAGVDTEHLATAYADLQDEFGRFAHDANTAAIGAQQVGTQSRRALAGVDGLGKSARTSSAMLASMASRLTLVSGAATATLKSLAALSGAALFTGAIRSAATLEDALTEVQAVSGATAEEMLALKAAAEEGGRSTRFTTLEAAQALGELARATGSATSAIETLPAALNLAQAAGLGVAEAAQFITTTLTQFGLSATEAGRVADVLALAANATTADVRGLGDALSYAAPLAKQLGLDTEQTVAVIGALADQGFRGERAGTALRNVFTELLEPSSAFGKELRDLGIETTSFIDVILGLRDAGARGQEALLELDAAARPAILSLVNGGGGALRQLEADLRNAGGAAETTAAQMARNLSGAGESIADSFDRTRRSLVEPLLEPLREELFLLANELEAFAQSPDFELVKQALQELFVEGAAAARELFQEIDFVALAQDIRSFVGDANQTLSEFRENITLVVSAVEMVGDAFSVAFNAAQFAVLGLAAAVAKLLQLSLQAQKAMTFLPRAITEWATGTTEATDDLNTQIGALGAVYEEFAERAGNNLGELVDATRDLADASAGAGDAAAEASGRAAQAGVQQAAAAREQAAASGQAAAALDRQAEASRTAASASQASASAMEDGAARLKQAFADLGIQSQVNLQRAAESAKRNFDAIREAVGRGQATAEDARRALAAYANAARAAVADSDVSARQRVESELSVLDAVYKVNGALEEMGRAGQVGAAGVEAGARRSSAALSGLADEADRAARSAGRAAEGLDSVAHSSRGATHDVIALGSAFGELSQAAADAYLSVNDSPLLQSWVAGTEHPISAVTRMIREQKAAFDEQADAIRKSLVQFDEFAARREALQQQYQYLGASQIEEMLSLERQLAEAQAKRAEEQKRAADEVLARQREAAAEALAAQQSALGANQRAQGAAAVARAPRETIRFEVGDESFDFEGDAGEIDQMSRLMAQLRRSRSVTSVRGGG